MSATLPGNTKASSKTNSKTVYLPGLNGLRAIAALAVVFSHTTLALGEFGLNDKILGTNRDGGPSSLSLAGNGVTLFFTLSGFLITYLILKEKEAGPIKVKDFYMRRILRIWPLYYLYLLLCLATILFLNEPLQASSIPFYVFLAANIPTIIGTSIPLLAHYWSLGVEEQFYLFFPQLAKQSNKKLLNVSLIIISLFLFAKMIFWFIDRKYGIALPYSAITTLRFHTMLIGVVGAILYYYKNQKFLAFTTHKLMQAIAWLSILLLGVNKFHVPSVITAELVALISVILIMGQITKKNYLFNLENKIFDFIGKISFGIYVIHPIIIFYLSKATQQFSNNSIADYIFVYLSVFSLTLFVSWASYEFYEKKFLKLKGKYATVKSSNTKPVMKLAEAKVPAKAEALT